jgi:UDP-glucose:(heptosyl)LPS alpha-1,3-glucosyltransferase
MRSARVGGTESYLNQVSKHLCERGHDVTIVCRSHEDAPHPSVRFHVLRSFAPGASLRYLAFARDVERHLRRTSYDLVVGLGRTRRQDVLRVSGGCHATYLERAEGRSLSRLPRKHKAILELEARALAPGAYRCVIANSELVRRDVVARYAVPPEKIRLIRNGVDLERFHPRNRDRSGARLRDELGIGAAGPVVLFLGSNYERKGLGVLLDAFPAFLREHPAATLLVVGADRDPSGWKRRARDLGIDASVLFLGKRADADACYGASDLYVLPTRYDSYAYTVLEALATGIPVIVSDAAGASEVVDGASGAVFPWKATAADLAALLSAWAPADRRAHAALACRRVAEANGADAAAVRTVALFEELVASGTGGSSGTSGAHGSVERPLRAP